LIFFVKKYTENPKAITLILLSKSGR
jgi:hypothetical protein